MKGEKRDIGLTKRRRKRDIEVNEKRDRDTGSMKGDM